MKLSENPIFITHKRLVHRLGVLAPVIIAALIGMVLLVGLGESLHNTFSSDPINAGKGFYGWVIGLEMAILILGGFNRIAQTLSEDQKAGLWDSNPAQSAGHRGRLLARPRVAGVLHGGDAGRVRLAHRPHQRPAPDPLAGHPNPHSQYRPVPGPGRRPARHGRAALPCRRPFAAAADGRPGFFRRSQPVDYQLSAADLWHRPSV